MKHSKLSIGLAAAGVLLVAFGLCIDLLGIGSPGFGPGQAALLVAGLVLCALGLLVRVQAVRSVLARPAVARLLLVLGSVGVGLVVVELCLRAVESGALAGGGRWCVGDPVLRLRGRPGVAGHDERGWRNASVPARAEVVALGDSQTWGANGSPSQAWPAVLAQLSGRSVYNMAMGGYGPVQYLTLLDEALKLKPDTIVVGLYFGNDVWDAYDMTYHVDAHAHFRDPAAGPELLRPLAQPERPAPWLQVARQRLPDGFSLRGWLVDGSATVRLVLRVLGKAEMVAERQYQRACAWALAHPQQGMVYERGPTRTVLTPAYRLMAVDMRDPWIREGFRLTQVMLERLQSRTREEGVRLLIVLIPTKEAVYAGVMCESGAPLCEAYQQLLEMETRARHDIVRFCKDRGIEHVDALPALQNAIRRGEQLYPQSEDGHFNARGYGLIGRVVNDALQSGAAPDAR